MKVNDEHEPTQTTSSSTGLNPHGLDQSSYTQKISAVGSAMSGKAMAAKDYVTSKLGYGESPEHTPNTKSSSPLQYGKKIALTVTEKLKPGEEDRALSEVISEAFNRRKDEVVKVGETAFGWQQQPHQQPPKGEVTESEELTRRLGKEKNTGTERSSAASAAEGPGRRVVDLVKDTVGSWLGKAGDQSAAPSQQSIGTSQGNFTSQTK